MYTFKFIFLLACLYSFIEIFSGGGNMYMSDLPGGGSFAITGVHTIELDTVDANIHIIKNDTIIEGKDTFFMDVNEHEYIYQKKDTIITYGTIIFLNDKDEICVAKEAGRVTIDHGPFVTYTNYEPINIEIKYFWYDKEIPTENVIFFKEKKIKSLSITTD